MLKNTFNMVLKIADTHANRLVLHMSIIIDHNNPGVTSLKNQEFLYYD
jgi:hypothetical protein